jgi:hypothetical protein
MNNEEFQMLSRNPNNNELEFTPTLETQCTYNISDGGYCEQD